MKDFFKNDIIIHAPAWVMAGEHENNWCVVIGFEEDKVMIMIAETIPDFLGSGKTIYLPTTEEVILIEPHNILHLWEEETTH